MFKSRPLFFPDVAPSPVVSQGNEPSAADLLKQANSGVKAPSANTVVLSLDEYTKLTSLATQVSKLTDEVKSLGAVQESIRVLYGNKDSDLSPEQAEPHLRRVLTLAGLSGATLEEEVRNVISTANPPSGDDNQQPAPTGRGKPTQPAPQPPAPPEDKVTQNLLRQLVRKELDTAVDGALGRLPGWSNLEKYIGQRDGDKAKDTMDKIRADFRGVIEQNARAALVTKRDQHGAFDLGWIPDAVNSAVPLAESRLRLYYGDPNSLGRTNEQEVVDPFAQFAKQDPVKLQGPDETGQLDPENLNDYITDALVREIAATGEGGGNAKF